MNYMVWSILRRILKWFFLIVKIFIMNYKNIYFTRHTMKIRESVSSWLLLTDNNTIKHKILWTGFDWLVVIIKRYTILKVGQTGSFVFKRKLQFLFIFHRKYFSVISISCQNHYFTIKINLGKQPTRDNVNSN